MGVVALLTTLSAVVGVLAGMALLLWLSAALESYKLGPRDTGAGGRGGEVAGASPGGADEPGALTLRPNLETAA